MYRAIIVFEDAFGFNREISNNFDGWNTFQNRSLFEVRLSSNLIELDSKTIKNRKRMMIFKYLFVLLYSENKQKGIMARIGYARVSTTGQNLDMQIAALEKSNCDRIFVEKVSGVKERPELQAALKYMRAGDTLIFAEA